MMYMPDCLKAITKLLEADLSRLKHHSDFNVGALSFCPKDLANEIRKYIPSFDIIYKPDYRQAIADSWPKSLDDSVARNEWGWNPDYNIPKMVEDMIRILKERNLKSKL